MVFFKKNKVCPEFLPCFAKALREGKKGLAFALKGVLKALIFFLPLGLGQHAFSQDESSPIHEQKEKQSEMKKIKSCTGTCFSYENNGSMSKVGHKSSFESYDKSGNVTETILYSPDQKISETTQCKYDSTGRLIEEKKTTPTVPALKHIYYYTKNGRLEYGKVYMDTAIVHTCTYVYDNDRLFEIITAHRMFIEKDVSPLEAIVYKYDDKGYKTREDEYELEVSPEKPVSGSTTEKANYTIKKLISSTSFVYDKNSRVTESSRYEDKNCIGRSEFKYDPKGNMTEEIYYNGCTEKPDYVIKYEYSYY